MIEKVLPYLSQHIPKDLAVKSISKINPQIAAFVSAAGAAGYATNAISDFLSNMVTEAPGRTEEKRRLAGKKSLTSAEQLKQQTLQQQDTGSGISTGKLAALAGGAAGLAGSQSQGLQDIISQFTGGQAQEQPGRQQSFFERAMEGLSFLDLPDTAKTAVGPIMKQMDTLEAQGVQWEDQAVQRLANQARNMASESTMVGQEQARFDEAYGQQPQQQQAGGGQEQLMAQMQALIGALRS